MGVALLGMIYNHPCNEQGRVRCNRWISFLFLFKILDMLVGLEGIWISNIWVDYVDGFYVMDHDFIHR